MKGYVSGWETCARSTYSLASSADQAIARNLHRIYYIAIISTVVRITEAPSTLPRRNLEPEVSLWKRIKCFPSHYWRMNLKTQQSPVILDLCLRITRSGKYHGYRDVIVFEKFRFQNAFRPHESERSALSNSSSLKGMEIELCFQISPAWYGRRMDPGAGLLYTSMRPKFRKLWIFFGQNAHVWTKVLGGKYSKTFQGLLVT